MRILSINTHGEIKGGASKVYLYANQLLAARGHAVAYLNTGPVAGLAADSPFGYSLLADSAGSPLQRNARLAAGFIYRADARALAERAVREFRPDVVHIHNLQGHLSTAVLLPFQQRSIPIVQTLHDYRLICPEIHFLSAGEVCEACKGGQFKACAQKRCLKGSLVKSGLAALGAYFNQRVYHYDGMIQAYIAPSRFLRDKMVEHGYAGQKISVLPNAYFGSLPGSSGARREHVLFAGRLSSEKGVDLLVRAAVGLGAPVLIAGDGPERARLQALAEQVGAQNVRFLGFLNGADLAQLYQTALLTVLPSRWYENGPLVVLESFANATPLVGARIGAVPEFVTEGQTGSLFAANDSADLQRVLKTCLAQPDALARMGSTAFSYVSANFSPGAYLDGLESILQQAQK